MSDTRIEIDGENKDPKDFKIKELQSHVVELEARLARATIIIRDVVETQQLNDEAIMFLNEMKA